MNYTYSIANDTLNAKVEPAKLEGEITASSITVAVDHISTNGDELVVVFSSTITAPEEATLTALVGTHDGMEVPKVLAPQQVEVTKEPTFCSPELMDGKVLYLKVHGMKATVGPLDTHEFQFTIPAEYGEVYLQGAEIYVDVLSQTDFAIKHPLAGVLEQYGYGVVNGRYLYKEKAQYASKLPAGLIISVNLTNTENVEQEFGVNFILHEIRDPNAQV